MTTLKLQKQLWKSQKPKTDSEWCKCFQLRSNECSCKRSRCCFSVSGANLDEIYDTVAALEKAGNKNLIIDATGASLKETYANAVQIRRAALKDQDRTFGYPTIVNTSKLAVKDKYMQEALVSLFTMKYGSIVVVDELGYAEALPLFGLRQNVFTDPQKPMKVEPGLYPLNGADENSICLTTVDFRTYIFHRIRRAGKIRSTCKPDHQRCRWTFRTDILGSR